MTNEDKLIEIIYGTDLIEYLKAIQKANLPKAWLVAGAVRNTVWKYLFPESSLRVNDIDVIHYSPELPVEMSKVFVERLTKVYPSVQWDCANQYHIYDQKKDKYHMPNGPYKSIEHSMLDFWFTVNTIGIRLNKENNIEILNPEALDDLFNGILRIMKFQRDNNEKWFEEKIHKITSRCSDVVVIR
jgi:hypothetical protein